MDPGIPEWDFKRGALPLVTSFEIFLFEKLKDKTLNIVQQDIRFFKTLLFHRDSTNESKHNSKLLCTQGSYKSYKKTYIL